jgi:hypothetical protein
VVGEDRVSDRPSSAEHARALELYKAGIPIERIAETTGLDLEVIEKLENEGYPSVGGLPELPSFRSSILDRVVRAKNSELDHAATIAESASATASLRARTALMAARIENMLMARWFETASNSIKASNAIKAAGGRPPVDPSELTVPKDVLAALRALRQAQDPAVDSKFGELFRSFRSETPELEHKGSVWDEARLRALEGMTPEQQEEYARTGRKPVAQRELFAEAG